MYGLTHYCQERQRNRKGAKSMEVKIPFNDLEQKVYVHVFRKEK